MKAISQFFGRKWTDGEKWWMGVFATVLTAGIIGVVGWMLTIGGGNNATLIQGYDTEITYRIEAAVAAIQEGRQKQDKGQLRKAVRVAFEELNGVSSSNNKKLVTLVDELRELVPSEQKDVLDKTYNLAMDMAGLQYILRDDGEFKTDASRARYQKALSKFAIPPEGLWPKFIQTYQSWKERKKSREG